jgi:hypothetical protein
MVRLPKLIEPKIAEEPVAHPDCPFLLSVGVASPMFGLYGHKYFYVKHKYKFKTKRIFGIQFTWTAYKRVIKNRHTLGTSAKAFKVF